MVSIVRGFLVGASLTPAAYRAPRDGSSGARPRSHAGAPVVRDDDLAYPAGQLAVRGHDQRADRALVVRLLADRARRDERRRAAGPRRARAGPATGAAARRSPAGASRSSAGATTSASARAWRDWSRTSRTAPCEPRRGGQRHGRDRDHGQRAAQHAGVVRGQARRRPPRRRTRRARSACGRRRRPRSARARRRRPRATTSASGKTTPAS